MKFDNLLGSGDLMQIVDVLGDHRFEEAATFEAGQYPVSIVGLSGGEVLVEDTFEDPPAFIGVLMEIG